MDKITQRYYDKYNEQIQWETLTHSVYCEIQTALLNKAMKPMWEALNDKDNPLPPPHRKGLEAKVDSLITLMAEISAKAIVLLYEEIGDVEDKTYKFLEDEVEPE